MTVGSENQPRNTGTGLLKWSTREKLTPYLFLAPTMIALLVVFIYPMIETVRMSFYSARLGVQLGDFVGFDNYARIFRSQYFYKDLLTSLIYSAGCVIFVGAIGLGTALLLNRAFPGRALARSLVILPWAVPLVTAAMIWGWMYNYEFGVINYLGGLLGMLPDRQNFLGNCSTALASVTAVTVWKLYPFGTVMFLAGLQTIPKEYYEAASVDGANALQSFWYVTLPGLRNISVFLLLLIIIWTFGRAFTVIFLLTGGGPAGCTETVVIRSYIEAFKFFRPSTAAALGVIVMILSLILSIAYLRVLNRVDQGERN